MMKIKTATLADLETLVPLFDGYRVFYKQKSNPEGASAFLGQHLKTGFSVIFLATDAAGKGLGFTQLYPTYSSVTMEKYYILNDLFVLPEERGKSIGKALLERAKQYATAQNLKGLLLSTEMDNPAQHLYEKLGWEKDTDFFYYFWRNK